MRAIYRATVAAMALFGVPSTASADVVSDWNEKAVAFTIAGGLTPAPAERVLAMVHVAMFDAVNSITGSYRPYLVRIEPAADATSYPALKEVAAASAAGNVLIGLNPQAAAQTKATLSAYLATLPDGPGKDQAVQLGDAVAQRVLAERAQDGAQAPDTYRPHTTAGAYVPTGQTVSPHWPKLKPFALKSGDQFRPGPPPKLVSAEWARDYNEIKELGARNSTRRTARQTEDARFWLATDGRVYYPLIKAVVNGRKLSLIDSARLYALAAITRSDAQIAVLDAKYHYGFWRPVTAIRNGDIDDNPATERDAGWLPIDNTPMHPEYPCAHCIISACTGGLVEAVLGSPDIPEVAITSPTLPGVTHRWTNVRTFYNEVSEARIAAGFHYRFSTRAGQDMGLQIARYVADNLLRPYVETGR